MGNSSNKWEIFFILIIYHIKSIYKVNSKNIETITTVIRAIINKNYYLTHEIMSGNKMRSF